MGKYNKNKVSEDVRLNNLRLEGQYDINVGYDNLDKKRVNKRRQNKEKHRENLNSKYN